VWPGKLKPACLITSLFIGRVVIASSLPLLASSTALLINSNWALPHSGVGLPGSKLTCGKASIRKTPLSAGGSFTVFRLRGRERSAEYFFKTLREP